MVLQEIVLFRQLFNGNVSFIAGDEEIDRFFELYFPNTSTIWAYRMIHPKARVAIAGSDSFSL